MLPFRLRQRYLASTWVEIVERVLNGPLVKAHPVWPAGAAYAELLEHLLTTQAFVPAGNTLTFGAHATSETARALRPNCSVFEHVSVSDAAVLWSQGIGVGTTVLHADEDPVARLRAFHAQWASMTLRHRPMRGNMFVYPATGRYVREFVACKSTPSLANALSSFNISVGVDSTQPLDAGLLQELAVAAWTTGDPGLVFLDRVNENVPLVNKTRRIRTLVPCGEQGMFDGEVCTLGAINLNALSLAARDGALSMSALEEAVRAGVTFLDNAVEIGAHPGGLAYRRVGLGVLGWADYLARVDVDYGSAAGRSLARTLSMFMGAVARDQSRRLATVRGPFPRAAEFTLNAHLAAQDDTVLGTSYRLTDASLRNVSVTCLAPTGGISLLTKNRGFSIEPFFHHATSLSVEQHIGMAEAWQTGLCNSVSKTVNMAESSTVGDVISAIKCAYASRGVKALSVYRAGSRGAQPIQLV